MTLVDLLHQVREELPGCEFTSVVEVESGLSLVSSQAIARDDVEALDAFETELHRVLQHALHQSGADVPVDDVVIQGRERTLVTLRLGESGYFLHVVTSAKTTLGFTQAVMRKYQAQILERVDALVGSG